MTFAHDTEVALVAAAALVNTDPGGGSGEDTLRTERPGRLPRRPGVVRQPGRRPGRAGRRTRAAAAAARAVAPRRGRPGRRAVNEILADAAALPQLVDHDDLGWHIHAVPQEAPLATRMAVEAAMAFTDVVRTGELDRLKTCAADDCDDVVVDLSRNRSKRFCEGGCGNRENVRAYRDRASKERTERRGWTRDLRQRLSASAGSSAPEPGVRRAR